MRRTLIACALAACIDSEPHTPNGDIRVAAYHLAENLPPVIGMLFVIDDTAAMVPYQTQLAALPMITQQVFEQVPFGMPNLRFVIATSTGQTGYELINYINFDTGYARETNYNGTLADGLGMFMNVGTSGTTNTILHGLVRSNAEDLARNVNFMGVVLVAASDDASDGLVMDYANITHGLTLSVYEYSFSLIGKPAPRLDAFMSAFPDRGMTVSLDGSDWAQAIRFITQRIKFPLDVQCFQEPADIDPNAPGPQYDCSMTATWVYERALPGCSDDGVEPCWYFQRDSLNCAADDHGVVLKVRGYGGGFYHPEIRGHCRVK